MSGQQDSYGVEEYALTLANATRFRVFQVDGSHVDFYRTRPSAEYAARQLNAGLARINPHAITGCKVESNA